MKLSFNPEQLEWLRTAVATILVLFSKEENADRELKRRTAKLMYKFTPNAKVVFLNQKERELLEAIVNTRLNTLIKQHSTSPEVNALQNLLEALEDKR